MGKEVRDDSLWENVCGNILIDGGITPGQNGGGEQLRYLWRRARRRSACACGPSPACLWEGAAFG